MRFDIDDYNILILGDGTKICWELLENGDTSCVPC